MSATALLDQAMQHHQAGRYHQAELLYREILESDPNNADAWHLLGMIANVAKQNEHAKEFLQRAIQLSPQSAVFHNNLGTILADEYAFADAIASFRQAIQHRPDYSSAHNNLGEIYKDLGRVEDALACYRQALECDPDNQQACSNLVMTLNYSLGHSFDEILAEHRLAGERFEANVTPFSEWSNDPNPDRALRIGYVSPDFRKHAVARFFESLVESHDPKRVTVYLYGEAPVSDEVTERLRTHVAALRTTWKLSAADVAQQIREDRIDILVDLAGHTRNNRLDVFAYRPAPVQATYLGYPNTTGLSRVDYRISDAHVEPLGEEHSTEEIVRLDGGCWAFRPPEALEVGPSPARTTGKVTFGSFHPSLKLNVDVLALWKKVLDAVPGSQLLLIRSSFSAEVERELRQRMEKAKLPTKRVVFRRVTPEADGYLASFREIDIVLDAFPFNGHTMTCETMWMGVPVVTLVGDRPSHRLGASVLHPVGLQDLIAKTPKEYVQIARRLASNLGRLQTLRQELRERVRTHLCDGSRVTAELENAYHEMWRRSAGSEGVRFAHEWGSEGVRFAHEWGSEGVGEDVEQQHEQGRRFVEARNYDAAIAAFREAIRLDPSFALAYNSLGNALKYVGRLDESMVVLQEGLAQAPDEAVLHSNLGEVYRSLCQFDKALACYRAARDRLPPISFAHSNYLTCQNYLPDASADRVFDEHLAWGKQAAEPVVREHRNTPDPTRTLRVGYISADFKEHPVSRFFEPILFHHSDPIECYLYAELKKPDEVSKRFADKAHQWRCIVDEEASRVAEWIRRDQIDILVDLTGHYSDSRLDVLAQQPAPVQIAYLGYPNTTGLACIDYWLTDRIVVPPDEPARAVEQIVYLEGEFSVFAPPVDAPNVNELPARNKGHITFGSHHNLFKLNDRVLATWARILEAVPESRLLFLRSSFFPPVLQMLRQRFEALGIDANRIDVFRAPSIDAEYLAGFHRIDLVLDTFPFGGHTMTCEALWMGVPLVTLRGSLPCGRLSASVLTSVGLPRLIARTQDEYVDIAVTLANDLDRLDDLRLGLRGRMQSALCDGATFTAKLERLYRAMWQDWCDSQQRGTPLSPSESRLAKLGVLHPEQRFAKRPASVTTEKLLAEAKRLHEENDYPAAEKMYRRILAVDGTCASAWHGLALLGVLAGRREVAVEFLEKALALEPTNRAIADDLAKLRPPTQTMLDEGERLNRQAQQLTQEGKLEEAVEILQRLTSEYPHNVAGFANLAHVLQELRRAEESERAYLQALRLEPNSSELHAALGVLRKKTGRLEEAMESLRNAVRLDANNGPAQYHLGGLLFDVGQPGEALGHLERAVQLCPDDYEPHNDLGNVYRQLERNDDAVASYRRALKLEPNCAPAHANIANLLAEQGRTEEARNEYLEAHRCQPMNRLLVLVEKMLPILYADISEIEPARQRVIEGVRRLEADGVRVDPTTEIMSTHFYLAYQGKNDRDLHRAFARLGEGPRRIDIRPKTTPPGKRVRIGFLSRYLRNHTIGQLNHNTIAHLSREKFEVFALSVGPPDAGLGQRIQASADHFLRIPPNISQALRTVAELQLDILFLPDIGMDATTYTMAFSRLAPLQVVTWGHPVTTGLPTVDYFITTPDLDPPGNEEHYTEKLARLSRLAVCYDRPELPTPKEPREAFGLSDRAHIYACPQTLFKFHPEFDAIMAGILRADPLGEVLLIAGKYPDWNTMLRTRFERVMPDVASRIRFLPSVPRHRFVNLLAVSDVLLDTIHFGGGNTSYEGFACGVPIVTWPSPLMRSRLAYAMYKQMDFTELVVDSADAYVEKAVRLGTEPDYREQMHNEILARCDCLYQDRAILDELGTFLLQALEEK